HVFGLNTVLGVALQVGGTAVLVERFHPRAALEAIRRHGITVVTGVPTMWSAWADLEGAPADAFASVRLAVSGAAPLDPAVRRGRPRALRPRGGRGLRPDRGVAGGDDGARHRRARRQHRR